MLDPDLEIMGGQSSRSLDKGGSPKNFFCPSGPQFGLKIRGRHGPRAPSVDPPLFNYICTCSFFAVGRTRQWKKKLDFSLLSPYLKYSGQTLSFFHWFLKKGTV